MRADRLVSLVLLLRQRGRMTADELAAGLEVSVRTVLRDIDALSTAGVPVYAERGRHGGYSLLPGFRTELTGLTHDEALALLTAGSGHRSGAFGLGAPLTAAMLKVVDALPTEQQRRVDNAARRLLVEPETDLLSRRVITEELAPGVMSEVRAAVLAGQKLRFDYAAPAEPSRSHTVDPVGLVTVCDRTYLLASKSGEQRTYRLSRMLTAEALPDPAERLADVELDQMWAERSASFLSESHLPVLVRVAPSHRDELLSTSRVLLTESTDEDGWVRLDVTYDDLRHAVWAIWRLGTGAEVLSPDSLRSAIRDRAVALAGRYDVHRA